MKKTRLITITLLFIISIVFIGCGSKNNLEKVLTSDGGTWLFNEADKSYKYVRMIFRYKWLEIKDLY